MRKGSYVFEGKNEQNKEQNKEPRIRIRIRSNDDAGQMLWWQNFTARQKNKKKKSKQKH